MQIKKNTNNQVQQGICSTLQRPSNQREKSSLSLLKGNFKKRKEERKLLLFCKRSRAVLAQDFSEPRTCHPDPHVSPDPPPLLLDTLLGVKPRCLPHTRAVAQSPSLVSLPNALVALLLATEFIIHTDFLIFDAL